MSKKIWLSSPHMCGEEMKYVKEAFETNWVAPLGANVNGFESDLSSYLGVKGCAALSSGTAAIHLALIILGVKYGDEVICQSFTFSATANPIVYQGATPIFVDSELGSWNMDPQLLEVAIKDRLSLGKKPKAIIVVHLYGMPALMDEIMEVANRYEIPVIEDAAEALGSRYKGRLCGTFGLMGILSFNGNKIITTSGGGALISDNVEFINTARFLSTQSRDKAPHYQHSQIGYNYRMSNVVAGIGRGQMKVIEERVAQRRANNRFYRNILSKYEGISFHTETEDIVSNYWLTTILVDPYRCKGVTREDIRLLLAEDSIETRPLWKPMHLQPVFAESPAYINGNSEALFNLGLCLPSSSHLCDEEKLRIEIKLKEVLNGD